jgi:hypothetical protein
MGQARARLKRQGQLVSLSTEGEEHFQLSCECEEHRTSRRRLESKTVG